MNTYNISVEQFGSLTAYDEFEKVVRFSEMWLERAAVFVFVRHFG